MSAGEPGPGEAMVPIVVLDELIHASTKLWEWLRTWDEPVVHADLQAFLRPEWRSAEEFVEYLDLILMAIRTHHAPEIPTTDW